MNTGIRVCTDEATFAQWAQAMPGMALPTELMPTELMPAELMPAEPARCRDRGLAVIPPAVAASLALHGCAQVAITLRLWGPEGGAFACFAIDGDLSASVLRSGDVVEVGLFRLSAVIEEVVRLVPIVPPAVTLVEGQVGAGAGVELTVVPADAAIAGWRLTLVGGGSGWRRIPSDVSRGPMAPVRNVRSEVAAELRSALIEHGAPDFPRVAVHG
jgi:hypothetical protein